MKWVDLLCEDHLAPDGFSQISMTTAYNHCLPDFKHVKLLSLQSVFIVWHNGSVKQTPVTSTHCVSVTT